MNDVADAFGVKLRAIGDWINRGMPRIQLPGDRNFEYDLEEIYEWRVAYINAKSVASTSTNPEIQSLVPRMGKFGAMVEEFKLQKADIISAHQLEAISNIKRIRKLRISDATDEEILGWTVAEFKGVMHEEMLQFAIGYDKETLERNKEVDGAHKILDLITKVKSWQDGQETDNG